MSKRKIGASKIKPSDFCDACAAKRCNECGCQLTAEDWQHMQELQAADDKECDKVVERLSINFDASSGRVQRKKDELDMQTYNVSPFDVLKDQLLPGTPTYASALRQAAAQNSFRKLVGAPSMSRGYMRDGVLQNMQVRKEVLADQALSVGW